MKNLDEIRKTLRDFFGNITDNIPDIKKENLVRLSLGEVLVYIKFLEISYERYKKISNRYSENHKKIQASLRKKSSGKMTKKEILLFNKSSDLNIKVRLEIESFYLFANILLNKIINLSNHYFSTKLTRNIKFESHRKFWKSIIKSNNLSKNILNNLDWIEKNIISYRDKSITHTLSNEYFNRAVIKGLSFRENRNFSLNSSTLYPDEKTNITINSISIEEITPKLKDYINNLTIFLKKNGNKSILSNNNQ